MTRWGITIIEAYNAKTKKSAYTAATSKSTRIQKTGIRSSNRRISTGVVRKTTTSIAPIGERL
ncbi:MAG: hypothetical protein KKA32_06755 [Actinobacteria bacterium]|nr:hypothetical protein [Actinomycetota bacterium]